jgi:hypothetical protein
MTVYGRSSNPVPANKTNFRFRNRLQIRLFWLNLFLWIKVGSTKTASAILLMRRSSWPKEMKCTTAGRPVTGRRPTGRLTVWTGRSSGSCRNPKTVVSAKSKKTTSTSWSWSRTDGPGNGFGFISQRSCSTVGSNKPTSLSRGKPRLFHGSSASTGGIGFSPPETVMNTPVPVKSDATMNILVGR